MFNDFKGAAKPLDHFDVAQQAHRIGVSEDHLQAFLNVESLSRGFGRDRRPIILNEPHVFYRNLSGEKRDQAVRAGLAYRDWGARSYPRTQDERYVWLHEAMQISVPAALKSCSWGMTQILGENATLVGYSSVEDMVKAFMADEEEHVEAMIKYILATGIADDLLALRWETVARVYNGPSYRKNEYHIKMAREFNKLRGIKDSGWSPDRPDPGQISITDRDTLRSVQRRLHELGYPEVGKVDGIYGTKLRAGVLAFRADNGLPIVADVDQELLAALMKADQREVSESRANTTVEEVRQSGSRQIETADKTETGGQVLVGGGILGGIMKALGVDEGGTAFEAWEAVQPVWEYLEAYGIYFAAALGVFIIYQSRQNKKARVQDEREGKHVGRG